MSPKLRDMKLDMKLAAMSNRYVMIRDKAASFTVMSNVNFIFTLICYFHYISCFIHIVNFNVMTFLRISLWFLCVRFHVPLIFKTRISCHLRLPCR